MNNYYLLLFPAIVIAGCATDAVFAEEPSEAGDATGNAPSAAETSGNGIGARTAGHGGAATTLMGSATGAVGKGDSGATGFDDPLDESCRPQVQACWEQYAGACGNDAGCAVFHERCRTMQISCQGMREICSGGYLYVDISAGDEQAVQDALDQAQSICASLAGDHELSGGSFLQHEDGVSYSCCWLQALDDNAQTGAAGASNP